MKIRATILISILFSIFVSFNSAKSEDRIKGFDSYIEFKNGEVICGEEYDSWHQSASGKVCAGGKYDSWHQSAAGKVCCGGEYNRLPSKCNG